MPVPLFGILREPKQSDFPFVISHFSFAIGGFKFEVQLSYVARSDSR
jgi:hypothetical protein